MRIVLALTFTTSVFLGGLMLTSQQWWVVVPVVERSIVRIDYPTSQSFDADTGEMRINWASCTGFVIDGKRQYVLTAYHCLDDGDTEHVSTDKQHRVRLLYSNPLYDLAVLYSPTDKPALKRGQMPMRGQAVGSLGYGYGLDELMFKDSHVAAQLLPFRWEIVGPDVAGIPFLVLSQPFVRGMSGGPIFDRQGHVVGIAQRTDEYIGLALPIDRIYELTAPYWEPLETE